MHPWQMLLAVAVVIGSAAPVAAQSYSLVTPDGTVYFTNVPTRPAERRAAFVPPETRALYRPYSREIAEAARRYGVSERLIWAVIRAESGFDPRAVSRRGAQGLMQLMPQTAAILGVRDCFDPRQNIDGGVRHLRAMLETFRNNLRLAIAAYNVGEKAVLAYRGVPPYPETQQYVTRVLRLYGTTVRMVELPEGFRIVERDGTIVYTNIPPADPPYRTGG
jgi:soluble lytic murein transglycosylase-like protein